MIFLSFQDRWQPISYPRLIHVFMFANCFDTARVLFTTHMFDPVAALCVLLRHKIRAIMWEQRDCGFEQGRNRTATKLWTKKTEYEKDWCRTQSDLPQTRQRTRAMNQLQTAGPYIPNRFRSSWTKVEIHAGAPVMCSVAILFHSRWFFCLFLIRVNAQAPTHRENTSPLLGVGLGRAARWSAVWAPVGYIQIWNTPAMHVQTELPTRAEF